MKEEKTLIADENMDQVTGGRFDLPHRPEMKPVDPNDPNDSRNWKRNPNPKGPPYILPPGCDYSWISNGDGTWMLIG